MKQKLGGTGENGRTIQYGASKKVNDNIKEGAI